MAEFFDPIAPPPPRRRSDGEKLIWGGGAMIVLAAIAALLAAISSANDHAADPDPVRLAVRFWLFAIAGKFFDIGILMLLTAAIVRAIWFLPGDETKPPTP